MTIFYFGDTLFDFGEDFNTKTFATSVFADYLLPGSTTPKDQPIAGAGLQGALGAIFNNSYLFGIAIDTSKEDILDSFSGLLGKKLALGPILIYSPGMPEPELATAPNEPLTGVQEARIFRGPNYSFLVTFVQNSEPGKLSVLRGQVK
jgi:hypothetical protein